MNPDHIKYLEVNLPIVLAAFNRSDLYKNLMAQKSSAIKVFLRLDPLTLDVKTYGKYVICREALHPSPIEHFRHLYNLKHRRVTRSKIITI